MYTAVPSWHEDTRTRQSLVDELRAHLNEEKKKRGAILIFNRLHSLMKCTSRLAPLVSDQLLCLLPSGRSIYMERLIVLHAKHPSVQKSTIRLSHRM